MFSQLSKAQRRDHRSSARFPPSRPLTLEQLETRLTPATHVWSGAASTLWSNAANWSAGGSPAGDASADLVYPASGATRFTSKDDLPFDTPIRSIEFDGVGYQLNATPGNRILLGADVTPLLPCINATNTSGVNAIDVDISLSLGAGNHTMTVASDGVLHIVRHVSGGSVGSNLVKDGVGELVFFSADNQYQNNTQVQAGTLRVMGDNGNGDYTVSALVVDAGAIFNIMAPNGTTVGSLAGSGSVVFGAPSSLAFGSDNTSTTFSGVISGTGHMSKIGSGTQTLSGPNTYTGITNILTGTLRLGSDNPLPSTTFVALIEGPSYRGTLDLANHNLTIAGLSQQADSGPSFATVNLGTGTLTLHNDVDIGGVPPYYGVISGTGGLVKEGIRSQKLGGDNTYTGPTTINGGTLEVDGNQPQSAVTVAAGAVLSGTGTVGPTTVLGTLRPGSLANPTGTLFVAGNVTFSGPSAIFAVELDGTGAGQYSRLNATGTVDLGTGTTLSVTFGYASSSGDTFPSVITCANLVNTFSVVPPGIQDSYSATGVDLSVL
jgi:autotransporter-associated beta strand protein